MMCRKPRDAEGSQVLNRDPSGDGSLRLRGGSPLPWAETVPGSGDAYVSGRFMEVYSCVLAGDCASVS